MFLTLRVVAFVRSCSSAVVDAGLAGSRCLMVSFLFPWLSDIVFAPCSAMLHGSHKAKKRMHRALGQVGQCMMLAGCQPILRRNASLTVYWRLSRVRMLKQ